MRMQQGSGHDGCAIDLTNGTSRYRDATTCLFAFPRHLPAVPPGIQNTRLRITHFAKIDETSSTHGATNSMIDTDSAPTGSCQTIDSPDFDSDAH